MSQSVHCLALLFAICMACVCPAFSKYVYAVYPKYVCCTCSVFTAFERKQESYVSASMLCNLKCRSPQEASLLAQFQCSFGVCCLISDVWSIVHLNQSSSIHSICLPAWLGPGMQPWATCEPPVVSHLLEGWHTGMFPVVAIKASGLGLYPFSSTLWTLDATNMQFKWATSVVPWKEQMLL